MRSQTHLTYNTHNMLRNGKAGQHYTSSVLKSNCQCQYFSPRDGRKFRSRNELRSYHDERGLQFQVERFDFSLGRKKMYRQKAAAAARAAAQEDR